MLQCKVYINQEELENPSSYGMNIVEKGWYEIWNENKVEDVKSEIRC